MRPLFSIHNEENKDKHQTEKRERLIELLIVLMGFIIAGSGGISNYMFYYLNGAFLIFAILIYTQEAIGQLKPLLYIIYFLMTISFSLSLVTFITAKTNFDPNILTSTLVVFLSMSILQALVTRNPISSMIDGFKAFKFIIGACSNQLYKVKIKIKNRYDTLDLIFILLSWDILNSARLKNTVGSFALMSLLFLAILLGGVLLAVLFNPGIEYIIEINASNPSLLK